MATISLVVAYSILTQKEAVHIDYSINVQNAICLIIVNVDLSR